MEQLVWPILGFSAHFAATLWCPEATAVLLRGNPAGAGGTGGAGAGAVPELPVNTRMPCSASVCHCGPSWFP